ncbi:hypothetical protein BZL69_30095 [Escherichia coli]|nr:hypothetical protein BZL69_30095 [Escherichia coli]
MSDYVQHLGCSSVKRRIRHLGTAAGCGVNALSSLQNQHFQRTCRPDKTRQASHPAFWLKSIKPVL